MILIVSFLNCTQEKSMKGRENPIFWWRILPGVAERNLFLIILFYHPWLLHKVGLAFTCYE